MVERTQLYANRIMHDYGVFSFFIILCCISSFLYSAKEGKEKRGVATNMETTPPPSFTLTPEFQPTNTRLESTQDWEREMERMGEAEGWAEITSDTVFHECIRCHRHWMVLLDEVDANGTRGALCFACGMGRDEEDEVQSPIPIPWEELQDRVCSNCFREGVFVFPDERGHQIFCPICRTQEVIDIFGLTVALTYGLPELGSSDDDTEDEEWNRESLR